MAWGPQDLVFSYEKVMVLFFGLEMAKPIASKNPFRHPVPQVTGIGIEVYLFCPDDMGRVCIMSTLSVQIKVPELL